MKKRNKLEVSEGILIPIIEAGLKSLSLLNDDEVLSDMELKVKDSTATLRFHVSPETEKQLPLPLEYKGII